MMTVRIAVLLLLLAMRCDAQSLLIVKDYNNCTVGLQDASGKWITEPVYEQIEPFRYGFARILRNGKWGLLNEEGKEVVAPKYATLNFACDNSSFNAKTTPQFLQVSDKDLSGIIDTNGKVILPCRYREISCRLDSVFVVREEFYWSFVHANGTVYNTTIMEEPGSVSPHVFRFVRSESLTDPRDTSQVYIRKYHGLITDKGEIVIPAIYDRIEASSIRLKFPGYEVSLNGKTGYYDPQFRTILDCEYDVWREPEFKNNTTRSYMFLYGYTGVRKNNKCGVITVKGDTILPFIFDSIRTPQYKSVKATRVPFWEVQLNGKWGVLDSLGKWFIQPQFEDVKVHAAIALPPKGFIDYSVCLARSNGEYGALNFAGDTLVAFEYDSCWTTYTGSLFWSPEECVILSFHMREAEVALKYETLKRWYRSDRKIAQHVRYRQSETYRPRDGDTVIFYNRKMWGDAYPATDKERIAMAKTMEYPYLFLCDQQPLFSVVHIERKRSGTPGFSTYTHHDAYDYSYYDNYVEVVYDSVTGHVWHGHELRGEDEDDEIIFGSDKTGRGILSSTGELIIPPNIYMNAQRGDQFGRPGIYLVHNFNNKCGLIDSTGALILDTAWTTIVLNPNDTLWTMKAFPGDGQKRSRNYWYAYNMRTQQFALDTSLHLLNTITQWHGRNIIETPTGVGLLEAPSMRLIIPPVYGVLYPLDDSSHYYAVGNCAGNFGVYDPQGKLIIDTTYSEIYLTEYSITYDKRKDRVAQTYVFSNNADDFAVLHLGKGTVSHDTSAYREIVMSLAANDGSAAYSYSYRVGKVKFPSLQIAGRADTLADWQYKLLFADMVTQSGSQRSYRTYIPGVHSYWGCPYRQEKRNPYDRDAVQPTTQVLFITDSLLTIQSRVNYSRRGDGAASWHEFGYGYRNYVMTSENILYLELPELFADTLWRAIVTDSVMSFLRAHPGINADCSRPHLYPSMLRRNFLIMKDGIRLYPNWTENTNGDKLPQRPVIFIPWAALRPHLKPELERKIR